MSSKWPLRSSSSLRRLFLWHALLLAAALIAVFAAAYHFLAQGLATEDDRERIELAQELAPVLDGTDLDVIRAALSREVSAKGVDDLFLRFKTFAGPVIQSTEPAPRWTEYQPEPECREASSNTQRITCDAQAGAQTIRLSTFRMPTGVLEIAESQDERAQILTKFKLQSLFGIASAVLIAAALSELLSRRILRRVRAITDTALSINERNLEQRMDLGSVDDELNHLARAFNTMLDRITTLLRTMETMTENLAHELRTPLMRLRGKAEIALLAPETGAFAKAQAMHTIEEVDRLFGLVNTMLDISEAETGAVDRSSEVDLKALLREAADLLLPAAEERGLSLEVMLDARCRIYGSAAHLQRAFANILENAIKYTPSGGAITLSLTVSDSRCCAVVADTGKGIPSEELPHIFERFFRSSDSSKNSRGFGLGLSLAKAVIEAHQGEIVVTSTYGAGTTVIVTLNVADDAPRSLQRPNPIH